MYELVITYSLIWVIQLRSIAPHLGLILLAAKTLVIAMVIVEELVAISLNRIQVHENIRNMA